MSAWAKVEPVVVLVGLVIIFGCHSLMHTSIANRYARAPPRPKGGAGVDTYGKMRFATIMSEPRKYYCPFLASAVMNDIDMEVFGWNYDGISGVRGWWRKILFFDAIYRKYDPDDIVMFVDSNDVIFNAKPDAIRAAFLQQVAAQGLKRDDAWLWSGEKNCGMKTLTRAQCEALHRTVGPSENKYMNTGAFIGRAQAGVDIMRKVNEDRKGATKDADQAYIAYSQATRGWRDVYGLDYNQSIFMSVYLAQDDICGGPPDFQSPLGNCRTGTTPAVYHFNAGAKDQFLEPVMKQTWWWGTFNTPEGRAKVDNAVIIVNSQPVKLKELCPTGYGKVRDHHEKEHRKLIDLGAAEKFDLVFTE